MNSFDSFNSFILPYCHITKVPVCFYDLNQNLQWECCIDKQLCDFLECSQKENGCKQTLASAIRIASQLEEPYFFICPTGLLRVAVSYVLNGKIKGYFIVGPVAMDKSRAHLIRKILINTKPLHDRYPELTVYLGKADILKPKDVTFLISLFNSAVLSCIISNGDYSKMNQRRKRDHILKGKKESKMDYPYELEKELISRVKINDANGAKKSLELLLDQIRLIESDNLSYIKIQVMGICAVLSRLNLKQDMPYEISFKTLESMEMLDRAESVKELYLYSANLVDGLLTDLSSPIYSGSSAIIKKAIQYINDNYMNKISLQTASMELHTNQSYLSTLFKKEMGRSFVDFLNEIRIQRSRELLSHSNISLTEISQSVGFESQSYFIKVFKRRNGITPGEFRKAN